MTGRTLTRGTHERQWEPDASLIVARAAFDDVAAAHELVHQLAARRLMNRKPAREVRDANAAVAADLLQDPEL